MKKLPLFVAATLIGIFASGTFAIAQMPVPLLDHDAGASAAQWRIAAPILQAGLECRQLINRDNPALRPLLSNDDTDQWNLVPPKWFTVFGLPVQSIAIYIDSTGEMGASYTAVVAKPEAIIFDHIKTGIGTLLTQQGRSPSLTEIICTIMGTRDLDDK